jgi:hypothetical protein
MKRLVSHRARAVLLAACGMAPVWSLLRSIARRHCRRGRKLIDTTGETVTKTVRPVPLFRSSGWR